MRRSGSHVTLESLRSELEQFARSQSLVEKIRAELERFARDTLQQEFLTLRDHIDKAVEREGLGPARSAAPVAAQGEQADIRSLVSGGTVGAWAPDDAAPQPTADSSPQAAPRPPTVATAVEAGGGGHHPAACAPQALPPPSRRSTLLERTSEVSEVRWATQRTGFTQHAEQDLTPFGRRRSGRTRYPQASGRPPPLPEEPAYTPLAKEDTTTTEAADGLLVREATDASSALGGRGSRTMAMICGEAAPASSRWTWSSLRVQAEAVLASETFDYAVGGVIFLNAIVIGMETEYMAANWCTDAPLFFRMIDRLFCVIFLSEIVMRFFVSGTGFFSEVGWRWNVVDLLVVGMQLADEIERAMRLQMEGELSSLRVLRLFRLIRLLRLTRMLYLLGGLRMLVVSIADSIRSLGWTLCLLFIMTFVFGIFLTQLVTDHKVLHGGSVEKEEMEELLYCFGSLDRAMLCLYETVSEGLHWHEVTGVFCESAIRTAEEDKKQVLMQQMHEMFLQADDDGSGTISAEEFEAHLKDPQMLMYLKAIDVNPEEARHLFALLDTEEQGEIEAEALVNGCLRLQGCAKAIELAAFMQEQKLNHQRWIDHADVVERSLSFLCGTVTGGRRTDRSALGA